jgi:hypothetical protein
MLRPRVPDPIGYQHAAARFIAVLVDIATIAVLAQGVVGWHEDPSINGPGFAAVSWGRPLVSTLPNVPRCPPLTNRSQTPRPASLS